MKCGAAVAFSPLKKAKVSVDYNFSVTIEVTEKGIEVKGFKGQEQRVYKKFNTFDINAELAFAFAIDLADDENWIPVEQEPDGIHSLKELGEAMKAIMTNTMPNREWLDMKMRIDAFLAEAELEVQYVDPADFFTDIYVIGTKGIV